MEQIKRYIEQITSINESDWDFFSSKMERKEVPSHTALVKKGEVEKYLSFISNGIVRLYLPGEERDVTVGFAFENEFVTAFDSFLSQTTSACQIETLTTTS